VSDIRKMMRPYTAVNLKEDAKNRKMKLADYATKLTGALGVTHLMALSQNGPRIFVRIARTPSGPTLGFHIQQFSLTKHVVASQKRPYYTMSLYDHPPVVVTNNFGDAAAPPHVKLMRITFQALFPAINVATVNLSECRRVVLFNLVRRRKQKETTEGDEKKEKKKKMNTDEEGQTNATNDDDDDEEEEEVVEIRHYGIKASPVGVDRKVRKLVQANIPNLCRCEDISDYILGSAAATASDSGAMSDSEAEDETGHVVLPQRYHGRGNSKSQKSALKLIELGPRMCLKLVKIERGLASGDVMYHAYVKKTPTEVKAQRLKFEQAAEMKKQRRELQESNVAAKKAAMEVKKTTKKAHREEREKGVMERLQGSEQGVDEDNAEE